MCSDPNIGQQPVYESSTSPIKLNEFQLCKKADIQQEKI